MRHIVGVFWINCQLFARCFFARRVDVAALFTVAAPFEPVDVSVIDSVKLAVHWKALTDVALSILPLFFAQLQVPVATEKGGSRSNFLAGSEIAHHASELGLLLAPDFDEDIGAGDAFVMPICNLRFSSSRLFHWFAVLLSPADL